MRQTIPSISIFSFETQCQFITQLIHSNARVPVFDTVSRLSVLTPIPPSLQILLYAGCFPPPFPPAKGLSSLLLAFFSSLPSRSTFSLCPLASKYPYPYPYPLLFTFFFPVRFFSPSNCLPFSFSFSIPFSFLFPFPSPYPSPSPSLSPTPSPSFPFSPFRFITTSSAFPFSPSSSFPPSPSFPFSSGPSKTTSSPLSPHPPIATSPTKTFSLVSKAFLIYAKTRDDRV